MTETIAAAVCSCLVVYWIQHFFAKRRSKRRREEQIREAVAASVTRAISSGYTMAQIVSAAEALYTPLGCKYSFELRVALRDLLIGADGKNGWGVDALAFRQLVYDIGLDEILRMYSGEPERAPPDPFANLRTNTQAELHRLHTNAKADSERETSDHGKEARPRRAPNEADKGAPAEARQDHRDATD